MRVFETLADAADELRRDVYKGAPLTSTRVQQRTGIELPGRERLAYTYSILGGWPNGAADLVALGANLGFKPYVEHPAEMLQWLCAERTNRLYLFPPHDHKPELLHPALKTTLEGNWPSYTYPERLIGADETMIQALREQPDSRRAFWPIFRPEDAGRMGAPTRIPCSLGYQAMLRQVGGSTRLILFYLQRSADFDNFWLSDIWLARQFQEHLAHDLDVAPGQLVHMVISLHSFEVEGSEVY